MIPGSGHFHDHPAETPQPNPSLQPEDTLLNWRVHHPFEGVEDRVAVEVAPWKGLLARWRFVVPGDFKGVIRWGVGPAGTGDIDEDVKRPVKDGPLKMVNGPEVLWFGGHESLSSKQSAYLVFQGEAPHYVAFGQADVVGGPPGNLEGISFGSEHPEHPGAHGDIGHNHQSGHEYGEHQHSPHNHT